jgi:excisionase family DNA binding protein
MQSQARARLVAVVDEKRRFLTLADVAEVLGTSVAQVYALVRRGELPAIKIGGRGQWRVEDSALEDFIAAAYSDARDYIASHPFSADGSDSGSETGVESG